MGFLKPLKSSLSFWVCAFFWWECLKLSLNPPGRALKCLFVYLFIYLFIYLFRPHGPRDLGSLTRDGTSAPCSGTAREVPERFICMKVDEKIELGHWGLLFIAVCPLCRGTNVICLKRGGRHRPRASVRLSGTCHFCVLWWGHVQLFLWEKREAKW